MVASTVLIRFGRVSSDVHGQIASPSSPAHEMCLDCAADDVEGFHRCVLFIVAQGSSSG